MESIKDELRRLIKERIVLLSVVQGSIDDETDTAKIEKMREKESRLIEEIDYYSEKLASFEDLELSKAKAELDRVKTGSSTEIEKLKIETDRIKIDSNEKIEILKAENERLKIEKEAETEKYKAAENAKARAEEAAIKAKEEAEIREKEVKLAKEKQRDNRWKFATALAVIAIAAHNDSVGMIHGAVLKVGEAITKIV